MGRDAGRSGVSPRRRHRCRRRCVGPAAGPDGAPGRQLGPARQRSVGDARRPPTLHPLQGDGLGRRRSDGHCRAHQPRPARTGGPVGGAARHDPRRCAHPRLRRRPQHLYPVLRLARPGCQPAHDPARGLPSPDRSPGAGHHYRDPAGAHRGRVRQALQHHRLRRRPHGGEGLFLACSFWLVDALHLAGQQGDATELFERLLALRNDVGLLSEEWDPTAGRQLGNTPQAFSHFPLVTSALQLHAGHGHLSNLPIRPSS